MKTLTQTREFVNKQSFKLKKNSPRINTKPVWDCLCVLNDIGSRQTKTVLISLPGHKGHPGNLNVKEGWSVAFAGPTGGIKKCSN